MVHVEAGDVLSQPRGFWRQYPGFVVKDIAGVTILDREFYARNATLVARDLLGSHLVRRLDGHRVGGIIVETEAYSGHDDLASHGRIKRTPRNAPMWEAPGHAYVYFTYGMYWLLNVVCEPTDQPAAVLIRAIEPTHGQELMARNREGRQQHQWTNGPARLTMALGIDSSQNRTDVTAEGGGLWIEVGDPVPDTRVRTGPRIGLGKRVVEPWRRMPWRWWIEGNRYVSR